MVYSMASRKKNNARQPAPADKQAGKSKSRGLQLSVKIKEEIFGLLLMAGSLLLILAVISHNPAEQPASIWGLHAADRLTNLMGIIGAYVSYWLVTYTFGYAVAAVPVITFAWGWLVFTHRSIWIANPFTIYTATLMIIVSGWIAIPNSTGSEINWAACGLIGGLLARQLIHWLYPFGCYTLWVLLSLLWLILVTRISIADLIPSIRQSGLSVCRALADWLRNFRRRQDERLASEVQNKATTVSREEIQKPVITSQEKKKPLKPEYLQTEIDRNEPVTVKPSETPVLSESEKTNETVEPIPVREPLTEKPIQANQESVGFPGTQLTASLDTTMLNDIRAIGYLEKEIEITGLEYLLGRKTSNQKADDPVPDENKSEPVNSIPPEEKVQVIEKSAIPDADIDLTDIAQDAFDKEQAELEQQSESLHTTPAITSAATQNQIKEQDAEDVRKTLTEHKPLIDEVNELFGKKTKIKENKKSTETKPSESKTIDFDSENRIARSKYRYPSLDLLEPTREIEKLSDRDIKELDDKIHQIIGTLNEFGIETKVVATEYGGPVVAIYQLQLPSGLKISKITGLEDELALSMKVKSVRMIPVTAKGTIQVEIPKPKPSPVLIRSLFEDAAFKMVKQKYKLGLALGKDIDGTIHFEDLSRMPHLLIAGTTGSGKSVGINTAITSLLYQFDPSEVKLILIDPKKVELALYRDLRNHHLICLRNPAGELIEDVITKPENAKLMLRALVEEMEMRYERLAHANVRNIEDYNKRWQDGTLPDDGKFTHEKLEYIVAIIDELADLMMTAPREVETYITRLAQMARAVGIHLVVATQRPSVDVLTGLIKANFPARIAYQVRSKIDSRTILDMGGAELLLGKGDMLYLPPGQMPTRIQNAFTSTQETEQIVSFISKMPPFPRRDFVMKEETKDEPGGEMNPNDFDSLFNEALEIVVKYNQGSASLLQRRLSVGYARAAKLIDQLERVGVVSAQDGSKARQVLITEDQIPGYRV